jgi:Winged helix-turn helix
MENITIAPQVRKSFITEMKRETKPSRRLRMHIILLASEGRSPTEISRVLFCSRTTVYAVVGRFAGEGRVAFDDLKRRGPEPLLGKRANERVEHLVEEDSPTDHGWLRSPASLELQAHRPPTVRGAGRPPGKPGDGAPRAPPARLPLEEAASRRARQRLRGAHRTEAR